MIDFHSKIYEILLYEKLFVCSHDFGLLSKMSKILTSLGQPQLLFNHSLVTNLIEADIFFSEIFHHIPVKFGEKNMQVKMTPLDNSKVEKL